MLSFLLRASFFTAAGDSTTIGPFLFFFYLRMNISTCADRNYTNRISPMVQIKPR